MEGIHFDLTYVPLKHLGYKSAVVNFSDIYAMNGTPRQIVVSLGISRRFTVEHIQQLYEGLRLACEVYGVDLVGGDTTSSRQGLVISVTVIGDAPASKVVGRDGARPNDLICVSGDLGAAYMGLQVLEREKAASVGIKDFEPQFAGKEYLVERQLKPEARRDIVSQLDRAGIVPTSMIDISDGLSSELLQHLPKVKDRMPYLRGTYTNRLPDCGNGSRAEHEPCNSRHERRRRLRITVHRSTGRSRQNQRHFRNTNHRAYHRPNFGMCNDYARW